MAASDSCLKEPVETFLAIVQTGAEVCNDFVPPAFGGTEGFEQFLLGG
jgi:hypothetical protein